MVSLAWLDEFKCGKEQSVAGVTTVDAIGKYGHYGDTDWYDVLYKKSTFAQNHKMRCSTAWWRARCCG